MSDTRHSNMRSPRGEAVAAPGQQTAQGGRRRRLWSDEHDGAFETNDMREMVDAASASKLKLAEKKALRNKCLLVAGILVAVLFLSLCVRVDYATPTTPLAVLKALGLWASLQVQACMGNPTDMTSTQIMALCPDYYQVLERCGITFQTLLGGAILALAGSLYQMVFRNPIAAPTMLGVSNGISIGAMVLVLQYTYAAPELIAQKYIYCYAGAIAVLLCVLLLTKLISGRNSMSIINLLMIGSIFSQLLGTIVNYVTDLFFTDELWTIYQEVNEALSVNTDLVSYIALGIGFLVCVIPVYIIRYSINAVSYSEEEAKLAGVNSEYLKVACLVAGTIMVIVAQVHMGQISMISLVVPFVSRAWFGTEFRKQFWGDLLIGALLLVVCRDITGLIPFPGEGFPIGTVVSFVTMPIYVLLIAKGQRGWN